MQRAHRHQQTDRPGGDVEPACHDADEQSYEQHRALAQGIHHATGEDAGHGRAIHRQLAAAITAGLIERIPDPAGGQARKHRPTAEGLARLSSEMRLRSETIDLVTAAWSPDDRRELTRLLRKYNESMEAPREQPWPRPY
ncbi:MarR family winged helix-turn-helix transcriptional regulator [Corynebacterium qintianiae]|uniref:MarR family winged helix-turn-helix transcriptional regulator n=1 Tax=Corynebacterium qintianiae TaxID=2709392 RepID=UPI001F35F904|nr:MarR family winged helix-turn-helix transcriptional regulator [Corynebacterium qintianiae]